MPQHQRLNKNKQKHNKLKNNNPPKQKTVSKKKKQMKQKNQPRTLKRTAQAQMVQRIERELAERASTHGNKIRSIKLGDEKGDKKK